MDNTFSKNERLCSGKLIDALFASGDRLMVFPYSVSYRFVETADLPAPAQLLISVSKRRFRHAVDRNRVKRLTRECYRVRKSSLYEALAQRGLALTFSLSYVHGEIMDFDTLSRKMDKLMDKLVDVVRRQGDSQ